MENTLILYDSIFGNTALLAEAMEKALKTHHNVEVRAIGEVFPERLDDVKILIIGTPTRYAKPTVALSMFLKKIPSQGVTGIRFATFDTRLRKKELRTNFIFYILEKIFGNAGGNISKQLTLLGGERIAPNEGFYISDIEGPLEVGELDRASAWALSLLKDLESL